MTSQTENRGQAAVAENKAEDEATEWIIRLSGTTTSDEDIAAWQAWLARSNANKRAYARVEEVWRLSGYMDELPWPTAREVLDDSYAGELPIEQWRDRADTLQQQPLWQQARVQWIGASLAVVIALTAAWQLGQIREPDTPGQLAVFETDAAENRDVTLADGSQVSLGGKSLISVSYTDTQRNVVLERGEAFFDVARNPKRPFVVHAGSKSIRAVGTAFNVAKYHDQVTVTVTEGNVIVATAAQVSPGNQPTGEVSALEAGQEVRYDGNTVELPVRQVDTVAAIAWRQGTLKYMAEPLSSVIQDVNRYSAQSVIVVDAEAGDLSFTGTVFQSGVDDWLASLEQAFPVSVEEGANGAIWIRAR